MKVKTIIKCTVPAISKQNFQTVHNNVFNRLSSMFEIWRRSFPTPALTCGYTTQILQILQRQPI